MDWDSLIEYVMISLVVLVFIVIVVVLINSGGTLESKCFPEHNFGMWIYDDDAAIRMTETEYQQECVK